MQLEPPRRIISNDARKALFHQWYKQEQRERAKRIREERLATNVWVPERKGE